MMVDDGYIMMVNKLNVFWWLMTFDGRCPLTMLDDGFMVANADDKWRLVMVDAGEIPMVVEISS